MKILKEITLPRRPVKNRLVSLYSGGDCGACVLAGLLGLPDAEDAYKLHISGEYAGGGKIPQIESFTRQTMQHSLEALQTDWKITPNLIEHVVSDIPIWPFGYARHNLTFAMRPQHEWRDYARALLTGGYYGIAQVMMGGHAPTAPMKDYGLTNHWIMICGWRYCYIPETDPERIKLTTGFYKEEFLIGDSAKSRPLECWVDANDFQNYWGGFAALWAKPINT